jgi:hypothetical protein
MKIKQTIQEHLASPEVVRKIRDWLRRNKHEARFTLAKYWNGGNGEWEWCPNGVRLDR